MSQLIGKGLTTLELIRFFYYFGIDVIKMALPLTILLASIMTFGGFGERYELAAMKSAGISLLRIMRPLIVLTIIFATILLFFSNSVVPDYRRKGKNMLYNIATTRPALRFTEGQFINVIPGTSVKFDKIEGENSENLEGVFIHLTANSYENQRTIIAKKGKFTPAKNKNYLKLVLYNGYIFEDQIANKTIQERDKQQNHGIKFDSLVSHFDISEIINKGIEEQSISDDYDFQSYFEIDSSIIALKKEDDEFLRSTSQNSISEINYTLINNDKKVKAQEPFKLDSLKKEDKLKVLNGAYQKIQSLKSSQELKDAELTSRIRNKSKYIVYQQRIITYSVTCFIFFLIGGSLGSIIRKGGMGTPIIIAIIVFMIFYIINISSENFARTGEIDPYFAAWLPNIILFPFGIWLMIKANNDSQILDAEKYRHLFKPIIKLFTKNKEHQRYQ